MKYEWDAYDMLVGCASNMYDVEDVGDYTWIGSLWNVYRIGKECVCHMCGTWLEYAWNIHGLCVEYVWRFVRACVDYL